MSEGPAAPDPVELVRHAFDAGNRHDIDAIMGFYAPDALWDLSNIGLGTFQGEDATRSFLEDWFGTWGDHTVQVQDVIDCGHGVILSPVHEVARLAGSDGQVEQNRAWVMVWVQSKAHRVEVYLDVDQARDAAERLAHERADG